MDNAFRRLETIDRQEALKKVSKKKNTIRPVLAITYDPRLPDIPGIVTSAYKSASADHVFKKTFPDNCLQETEDYW